MNNAYAQGSPPAGNISDIQFLQFILNAQVSNDYSRFQEQFIFFLFFFY